MKYRVTFKNGLIKTGNSKRVYGAAWSKKRDNVWFFGGWARDARLAKSAARGELAGMMIRFENGKKVEFKFEEEMKRIGWAYEVSTEVELVG